MAPIRYTAAAVLLAFGITGCSIPGSPHPTYLPVPTLPSAPTETSSPTTEPDPAPVASHPAAAIPAARAVTVPVAVPVLVTPTRTPAVRKAAVQPAPDIPAATPSTTTIPVPSTIDMHPPPGAFGRPEPRTPAPPVLPLPRDDYPPTNSPAT